MLSVLGECMAAPFLNIKRVDYGRKPKRKIFCLEDEHLLEKTFSGKL